MQVLQPVDFLERYGTRFPAWGLNDSRTYTRALALGHYENFTAVSWLLPRKLRQDYCNIYAYCRWADDLADEIEDTARSIELLNWWSSELEAMSQGRASHPVFIALKETVSKHLLPSQEFADLLAAFMQDQTVTRYQTYNQLLAYCRYSANPVGRIILRLNGCKDESLFKLSDATCTALQLANHWQDIRRDWERGRIYIPEEIMNLHGFSYENLASDIQQGTASLPCCNTVQELVGHASDLFVEGLSLANNFSGRMAIILETFSCSGIAVLDKIRYQRWDTISHRPTISKSQRTMILLRVMMHRTFSKQSAATGSRDVIT